MREDVDDLERTEQDVEASLVGVRRGIRHRLIPQDRR